MKKLIIYTLILFSFYSCIKKKALKYDPKLVGTWVSYQDNTYSWLTITPDGMGQFASKGDENDNASGEVKYSVFEKKMWVGKKKFKVTEWLTGKTDGVDEVKTKEYSTMKDTTYAIDYKMILKNSLIAGGRSIIFYRVEQ